ncbi:MAG TPA: prepilin-type N-terminal cleavage/methylation domain-containing protein [Gemmatimonadaceae bacterium]|nr:prepilin-type N-terminal cleavage/methylation domain-containing protein [Gemmatimonadaceae bacterium]
MSRPSTPRRVHAARAGFTLAEFMIAIVLFGIVMSVGMRVLERQQRFHRGANAVVEMRGQMRAAIHAVPSDLRPIFPAGDDIHAWGPSAIRFRGFRGNSILCLRPTSTSLILPPTMLTQLNTLTAWLTPPEVGDSILVYDENLEVGNQDDLWRPYQITAVAPVTGANGCTATTGYTVAGDATRTSWLVTLSGAMPTSIIPGAPVRIFRPVRYELYQAADGRWYLGASDCLPGRTPVCTDPQPVSGPYRADNVNPLLGGLQLQYFDAAGTALDPAAADPHMVVRIGLIVRAETNTPFNTAKATGRYRDSLSFTIGLRNR